MLPVAEMQLGHFICTLVTCIYIWMDSVEGVDGMVFFLMLKLLMFIPPYTHFVAFILFSRFSTQPAQVTHIF